MFIVHQLMWHPDFSRSPCRDLVGSTVWVFYLKAGLLHFLLYAAFVLWVCVGIFIRYLFILKRALKYTVKKNYIYIYTLNQLSAVPYSSGSQ